MRVLDRFVLFNRSIARLITPHSLPDNDVFNMYLRIGTILLSHPRVRRTMDVGAGAHWWFPAHYKSWYGIHLIGVDIDPAEMAGNHFLDERLVTDVVDAIPVAADSIDLVMVRSGLEHFADNERFLRNAFTALRPGGFLLAAFPDRFAPFAIVNRLLPQRISRRVLRATMLETADELGFHAYYDRTRYASFRRMSQRIGFLPLYYFPGFSSHSYFEFLLPLYVLSYVYDSIRQAIGSPHVASYHLWVLQKPGLSDDEGGLRFYAWR